MLFYMSPWWWPCTGRNMQEDHKWQMIVHCQLCSLLVRDCMVNITCVIVEEWKTNLMSLAILFHFLRAQHVSDINISIIRSLRLCCWITTLVVLFSVRCVLEIWVVLVLQAEAASACNTSITQNQPHQISNTQRIENKTTDVVIQQHSRKLLMMDILMSEICWAYKKWNKIASDIKLVFHSSTKSHSLPALSNPSVTTQYKQAFTFTFLCLTKQCKSSFTDIP